MAHFKSEDGSLYLLDNYCEFYIPLSYFDGNKFGEDLGQEIKVLGLFPVGFFSGDKTDKPTEIRVMKIPTTIQVFVSDYENRAVELPGYDEPEPCKVIKYVKGEKVMVGSVVQDSSNVLTYLNFIVGGKLPKVVAYDKSMDLWKSNQSLNGDSLGVQSVIEEMILSCLYRNPKNTSEKFASVIGRDPSTSPYDYNMVNIRQVCQYASTFTAITFEDMTAMVTSSLNRSRTKGAETESPIEQIVRM